MALVATVAIGASPAAAAAYDFQDPIQAGCSGNAGTFAQVDGVLNGVTIMRVELRKGPACNAYWTRTTSYQGSTYLRADVKRTASNGNGQTAQFGATSTQVYGNMLGILSGFCYTARGYAFGYWIETRPICYA
jgi:hypothetical protein